MTPTPWHIPPEWAGETVVIIASGPSLSMEQIEIATQAGCRLIGINDAWRLAPWMDLHYACDLKWWNWHHDACREALACRSVTQSEDAAATYPDLTYVVGKPEPGLSADPTAIHTGKNSGYQAINLAVHLGATRILLIGYDMKIADDGASHWFGDHPDKVRSWYETWFPCFATLPPDLERLGVEVINCTPGSALPTFPMARLEDVI
jgi:hypothetical protein